MSILEHHIAGVYCGSSEKEMRGPDTAGIVAAMEHHMPFWNGAKSEGV